MISGTRRNFSTRLSRCMFVVSKPHSEFQVTKAHAAKKTNVADEYLSNGHYAYESAQRKQTSANIREIMTEREKRANDMCSLSYHGE